MRSKVSSILYIIVVILIFIGVSTLFYNIPTDEMKISKECIGSDALVERGKDVCVDSQGNFYRVIESKLSKLQIYMLYGILPSIFCTMVLSFIVGMLLALGDIKIFN